MSVTVTNRPFGTLADGRAVTAYTLADDGGMQVTVLDYGAILQSVVVPVPGGAVDVVLGFDSPHGYQNVDGYLGALIGRNANRLGDAFIEIDGCRFALTANEGTKQLHGGLAGFNQKLFDVSVIEGGIALRCESMDGEEGYPGTLSLTASYTLQNGNALSLDYFATCTKDTVVNITNHSYFNLNGGGDAMQHTLRLNASRMTPMDALSLPDGSFAAVAGTPFDFTTPHTLAQRIDTDDGQLVFGHGYDHNFALDPPAGAQGLALAAVLTGDKSGIVMECTTTCPGIQLYTANFLNSGDIAGKGGAPYRQRQAVCLETQYFPNANICKNFPSTVLRAGKAYHETTVYSFSHR